MSRTATERAAAFARARDTILDAGLSRQAAEQIRAGLTAAGLDDDGLWPRFLATLPDGGPVPQSGANRHGTALLPISGRDILATDYAPLRFLVPKLIVEGVTLLAGRPKIGKSWLLLCLAVAVVFGGPLLGQRAATRAGVLYLALEDSPRRIKKRLHALGLTTCPEDLYFLFELPRLDAGGAEALDAWLVEQPDVRLVVLDVLNRLRGARPKNIDPYQHDAAEMGKLQAVAQRRGVSLVVATHDRKAGADDWLERVTGTLGIAGTADTVALLERNRGAANGRLRVVGRDLEDEPDLSLEFKGGLWSAIGHGDDLDESPERQMILAALRASTVPMGPAAVALVTGLDRDVTKQLLLRLHEKGKVLRPRHGLYTVHFIPIDPTQVNEGNKENGE